MPRLIKYCSALRFHTKMLPSPILFSVLLVSVPPMDPTKTMCFTPAALAASNCFFWPIQSTCEQGVLCQDAHAHVLQDQLGEAIRPAYFQMNLSCFMHGNVWLPQARLDAADNWKLKSRLWHTCSGDCANVNPGMMPCSFDTNRLQKNPGNDVQIISGLAEVATIRALHPFMASVMSSFTTSAITTALSSTCKSFLSVSLPCMCRVATLSSSNALRGDGFSSMPKLCKATLQQQKTSCVNRLLLHRYKKWHIKHPVCTADIRIGDRVRSGIARHLLASCQCSELEIVAIFDLLSNYFPSLSRSSCDEHRRSTVASSIHIDQPPSNTDSMRPCGLKKWPP
jgi:hypothetical protein